MGDVNYLLGTEFNWLKHKDRNIYVNLCQSALTELTAHQFSVQSANFFPNMTPYRSGFPIDSIPPIDPLNPDIPCQRQFYKSIFGCKNWIATYTHHDIAPVITFFASYSNYTHPQHYKATVHALKYLTSANEYGISFHSNSSSTIQALNQFPHYHDK